MKNKIFLRTLSLLISVILLLPMFVGCNDVNTPADTGSSADTEKKSTDYTEFNVGDIMHLEGFDLVYAASDEYKNERITPKDGCKFIGLDICVVSSSVDVACECNESDFICVADGVEYSPYEYDDIYNHIQPVIYGRSLMSKLVFEIPENASDIFVKYGKLADSQKPWAFVYEGKKISRYYYNERTNEQSKFYLNPGDEYVCDNLIVRFLSCYEYVLEDDVDPGYLPPDGEYTNVTSEIEFENVSDSDICITNTSFNCYADGKYLEWRSVRDDVFAGVIAPGETLKGTVTYKVPKDVSYIEFTYDGRIWTHDFLTFNASGFREVPETE